MKHILLYILTLAMAASAYTAHSQSKIVRDKQRDNTNHTAVSKAPSNRRNTAVKPTTTAKKRLQPAARPKKTSRQTSCSHKTEPNATAASEETGHATTKEKAAPHQSEARHYLHTETDNIRLGAAQQEITIKIDTNCDWHVSGSPMWTYIQKTKSGIVALVFENTGTKDRQGKIAVSHGTETEFINIRQSGMPVPNGLYVESNDIAMKAVKSLTHIKIRSNLDWQASSMDSWIQVKKLGAELYIYVAENTNGEERHGYVKIKNDSQAEIIRIVQAAE